MTFYTILENIVSEEQIKILDSIYDNAFKKLNKYQDRLADMSVVNSTLGFVERVIPGILKSYEGSAEYDLKCFQIVSSMRVTISQIMPIKKFMQIMRSKDMKKIDLLIAEIEKKGYIDMDAMTFLKRREPEGMYG